MKETVGDMFELYYKSQWIVIPTNIGWKNNGSNPMGTGVAKIAADMFPELPFWYGERCQKYRSETAVCPYEQGKMFIFPTKELDEDKPYMSWSNMSSVKLITRSLKQLVMLIDIMSKKQKIRFDTIGIPLVGCGSGGLRSAEIKPLMKEYLDDRFLLYRNKI